MEAVSRVLQILVTGQLNTLIPCSVTVYAVCEVIPGFSSRKRVPKIGPNLPLGQTLYLGKIGEVWSLEEAGHRL